jgi:hypothetical protein
MSKKITIVPKDRISVDFLNIVPASDFIPEWYRKSPSTMRGTYTELSIPVRDATNSTYKRCTPFFDALTLGYMAFLTADIEVSKKPNGLPYISWRTGRPIISEHSIEQWDGLVSPKGYSGYVFKWHNSLGIKTPKGYSLLFTNPANRFDLPFMTVTGFVDTDTYGIPVQFPFFVRDDFQGIIEKGTPIAQIIPVKRESWSREYEEYDDYATVLENERFKSTIKRSYKNNFWTRKEYK